MSTTQMELTPRIQRRLLELARRSIKFGLEEGRPLPVSPDEWEPQLWHDAATFVTLHRAGRLRGCIGTVEPVRPLPRDVAYNAYAAAFQDPRFPPLDRSERFDLTADISILGPLRPIEVTSEADLLRQIRPGIDGLILQAGSRQGLFLPAVWESLPQPEHFVRQLKLKAGLPADAWSPAWRFYRFQVESFGESKGSRDDGRG